MPATVRQDVKFSHPGIYSIKVLGGVKSELWDYFEGETKEVLSDESGTVITTLTLKVKDQAELSGILQVLYRWRLVLLSVKMVSPEKEH